MKKYFFEYDANGNILSTRFIDADSAPDQPVDHGTWNLEFEIKEWAPGVQRKLFAEVKRNTGNFKI